MTDHPDFDLDPEWTDPAPEAETPPESTSAKADARSAEPVVVIQYRNRGLPAIWLFPLTLVVSLALFTAYHRVYLGPLGAGKGPPATPERGEAQRPVAQAVDEALAQVAAIAPTEPLMPLTLESQPLHPGIFPFPVDPPTPKATDPPLAAESTPAEAAKDEPAEPEPAPLSIASTRSPDLVVEPEAGSGADPVGEPAEPAPPTREELMERIRQEGLLKQARQEELERRKLSARQEVEADALARVEGERDEFRRALGQILAADDQEAGAAIDALCSRYGRVYSNDLKNRAYGSLSHYKGKLSREEEVQMLRAIGVPEAGILDYLANRLHRSMRSRRGPKDADEVRVFAARQLLRIKPVPGVAPAAPAAPLPERAEARSPSVRRTTSRRN